MEAARPSYSRVLFLKVCVVALALGLPGAAYAGLVSHWAAEGNATDSVGTNHGTYHGNATYAAGIDGQGFDLGGGGDWIEVPDDSSLSFPAGQSFSISCWFKGSSAYGGFVGKTYIASEIQPFYMLYGTPTQVSFFLRDSAGSYNSSQANVTDGTWHYLVGVADSSTDELALWVDGVNVDDLPYSDGGFGTGGGVLHMGNHANRDTIGVIDQVAVYDHALTQAEIEGMYVSKGVDPNPGPPIPTLGEWAIIAALTLLVGLAVRRLRRAPAQAA
jgi:concanavalin A-like lectin/glucanase superfamily protein/exosortase sorting signal-containing protein